MCPFFEFNPDVNFACCCYNPWFTEFYAGHYVGRCVGFIAKHSFDRTFAPPFRFSLEKFLRGQENIFLNFLHCCPLFLFY